MVHRDPIVDGVGSLEFVPKETAGIDDDGYCTQNKASCGESLFGSRPNSPAKEDLGKPLYVEKNIQHVQVFCIVTPSHE